MQRTRHQVVHRKVIMPVFVILLALLTFVLRRAISQASVSCVDGTVNITGQGLTEIPTPDPSSCSSFGPLKLILTDNNFQTLFTGSFESYPRLDLLNLSSCRILRIDPGAFKGTGVKDLDISYNSLTVLVGQPFESLHLETLDLRGAGLVWIEAEVFADGFQGLIRLDLSYNKLTVLERIFDNMTNLMSLDLSRNRLKGLDLGLFDGLRSLVTIDFSHNPLTAGPVVLRFSSTPFVALVNCSITSLPILTTSDSAAAGDEVIRMDIRGNLIECDCSYVDGRISHGDGWGIMCDDGKNEKSLLCPPAGTTTKPKPIAIGGESADPRQTCADLCPTCPADDSTLVGVTVVFSVFMTLVIAVILFMFIKRRPSCQREHADTDHNMTAMTADESES